MLAGAIRYWPVRIVGQNSFPALLLGPVAVHPTRQGEGLGGMLIHNSLDKAASLGWDRVMLVGDAPYYKRFGFSKLDGVTMPPPTNPERVLAFDQENDAWSGVIGSVQRFETDGPTPITPNGSKR